MLNKPFSVEDKNLPLKVTASFIMAAAVLTLPLAAMEVFKRLIEDPFARTAARLAVDGSVLVGGSVYLINQMKNTFQMIARRLHPVYKADFDGVGMLAINSLAGTATVNGVLLMQVPNYGFHLPYATPVAVLLGSFSIYGAYGKVHKLLEQNRWQSPVEPKNPWAGGQGTTKNNPRP